MRKPTKRPSRVTRYARVNTAPMAHAPRFAGCNEAWIAWGMGHPYIAAHSAFIAGQLTITQAAALICSDRDFVAEFELNASTVEGATAFTYAREIVTTQWAAALVARIQQTKQEGA